MNGSVAHNFGSLTLVLAMFTTVLGCWTPIIPSEYMEAYDDSALDCSADVFKATGPLDVAITIDTSLSTFDPSGLDVDGDGIIGAITDSVYTDPDDSQLAAIVSSVLRLLEDSAGHDIRFSLVTFSGRNSPTQNPPRRVILNRDAVVRVGLTADLGAVSAGVDDVLERGSKGMSNFFAGMRRSSRSLIETTDRERVSRRLVLFISDSPTPMLRREGDTLVFTARDGRLESSAREAIRHRIVFNTFGVSEGATMWRRLPLGLIAGATGGTYHPVEDASALYCHLVDSLTIGSDFTAEEMEEFLLKETPEASDDDAADDSPDSIEELQEESMDVSTETASDEPAEATAEPSAEMAEDAAVEASDGE